MHPPGDLITRSLVGDMEIILHQLQGWQHADPPSAKCETGLEPAPGGTPIGPARLPVRPPVYESGSLKQAAVAVAVPENKPDKPDKRRHR